MLFRSAAGGGNKYLRNLLFVLGLGTALLAGLGAYLVYQYSKTLVFDETNTRAYSLEVEKNVDSMTPANLWDDWDTILEARVLPAWELMGTDNFKRYATTLQWAVRILSGLTAAGLLCLVSSFFVGGSPRRT